MKANRYYGWLLKSKKHQCGFKNWLVDNGFDVCSDLKFNEVIKFHYKNGFAYFYVTGRGCSIFNTLMRKYKKETSNESN